MPIAFYCIGYKFTSIIDQVFGKNLSIARDYQHKNLRIKPVVITGHELSFLNYFLHRYRPVLLEPEKMLAYPDAMGVQEYPVFHQHAWCFARCSLRRLLFPSLIRQCGFPGILFYRL